MVSGSAGKRLPEFAWSNDSQTLWYVRKHPPRCCLIRSGGIPWAPPRSDVLVYEEKDETFYVSLHTTTSQQFVVIYLASATTSEVRLLNAEMPDAEPVCFLPRRKDHEYSLDHYQHAFYLRSNREGKTLVSIVPMNAMNSSGRR
jgi:oligopeptidase B